jgi:hypothetical protein
LADERKDDKEQAHGRQTCPTGVERGIYQESAMPSLNRVFVFPTCAGHTSGLAVEEFTRDRSLATSNSRIDENWTNEVVDGIEPVEFFEFARVRFVPKRKGDGSC